VIEMNLETILGLLGGGFGVFVLKFYADWHKLKHGYKKDALGAWQEIATRETSRFEKIEARVTMLEKIMLEKDFYIKQLESVIIQAGLNLPVKNQD
jgi:hypothetical protein